MAVPLDDYPIHQTSLSMEYPASSDRNFYDRYYLCGFANDGGTMFLSGLGVYPNLGVIDAYITVRIGDKLHTVRTSSAQTQGDRLNPKVGPYSIDVVEPLQQLHVVVDGDEHGVGADLTWTGAFPAIDEAYHLIRRNGRISVEAQRFAQVGTWSGELRIDGTSIEVTDANWSGARDRSWGIRPSGEAEPVGRDAGGGANAGFWWLYLPIRFDDYGVMIIAQEDADGTRTMTQATRFWGKAGDVKHEDLGFPESDIVYTSGTRMPERATIHLGRRGKSIELQAAILANIPLNSGPGYGNDPDWNHGLWKGEDWVEGATLDSTDPKVAARLPFTLVDHACRYELNGDTGYGLFEHGTIGRHDPTGFADFMAVAP